MARLIVVGTARRFGMDNERAEDLRIAVSEATTNAILAHRRHGAEEPIVLSFGATDDHCFEVTIADAGPGFEPEERRINAERDSQAEGGLGVTLIRGLADDVEFVRGVGMQVNLRFAMALSAQQD